MDVEGVTNIRALRAKFQNDSNLAHKLVQPRRKPPTEIPPKPGSGGNAVSSPLPLSKREVIKPKHEPAQPASQPSALTQCNPLAWPRAKLGYMEPTGHNEDHKGNVLEKGLSSPEKGPEKPPPSSCIDWQGPAQTAPEDPSLPNSFHRALKIWENALSCGEKANVMLPTQRATNLYVHPCPEQRAMSAPAASGGSRTRPSGSKPMLDLPAQKKDALRGSGTALPQAPRGHRGSDGAAAESAVATAFCQAGYPAPGKQPQHQKEPEPPFCQPRAEKWFDSPGSKWPRVKALPSVESLGPAPGKPARPPKFDLSAFRSSAPSVHRGNETTADEEDYLTPESAQLEEQHNDEETPMYLNQSGDATTLCVIEVPKEEPQEYKKQKTFFFAKSSPGRAIIEDEKEEKTSLEREKQEGKKIFKTGENEYVSPISHTKEGGRGGMKVPQVKHDVTSAQTAKRPTPQGLAKDGAKFLAVSQEDTVYDDVETGQREPREKDDKYKTWMPKFRVAKEDKDQRKTSDDVDRKIFKVKKSDAEKSKKMEKEEKFFRKTFMYDKEIKVINTATAECSVPSKRRVDLPLTAGEQLDVIDVTEGSAVICRNSEGRYGYVLVEHLNFRQY
ncbi:FYN-binding protein 2 isoform X5 [Larus michahellis]|uniref:FYN-binding protein 2 isoform X5 n=1 Tax=Larus michahellis TaxID=119627 RepID=UPI003D9AE866